jgi:hypothetical protein
MKAKARQAAQAAAAQQAPASATEEPFAETDVAAQAATMQNASAGGMPFCEECAKAAAART